MKYVCETKITFDFDETIYTKESIKEYIMMLRGGMLARKQDYIEQSKLIDGIKTKIETNDYIEGETNGSTSNDV